MSAKKEDGGPAFPAPDLGFRDFGDYAVYPGMTLRDVFAIAALPIQAARYSEGHEDGWDGVAEEAYAVADAMLKARAA